MKPDGLLDNGTAAGELPKVLAEATRAAEERAREIVDLRQSLSARLGSRIAAAAHAMATAFASGGRLFTFGTGVSATAAASVAAGFRQPGDSTARPLPAMSLATDGALLTGLTADLGFDVVFARQLAGLGHRGDIALALSTTGDGASLLRGLEQAHQCRMLTIGLAGSAGGAMAATPVLDCLLAVPSVSPHRIHEAQVTVCHLLWELTQQALADTGA